MYPLIATWPLLGMLVASPARSSGLANGRDFLPISDVRFSSQDYLILRGRMRECMSWDGRILEIHDLSKSTSVHLLGLRAIDVDGKTVLEIYDRLRALLNETFAFEQTPFVTVEIASLIGMAYLYGGEFVESQAALSHSACPEDPPKAPVWWPRGPADRKLQPYVPPSAPANPPESDPLFRRLAEAEHMPVPRRPVAAHRTIQKMDESLTGHTVHHPRLVCAGTRKLRPSDSDHLL